MVRCCRNSFPSQLNKLSIPGSQGSHSFCPVSFPKLTHHHVKWGLESRTWTASPKIGLDGHSIIVTVTVQFKQRHSLAWSCLLDAALCYASTSIWAVAWQARPEDWSSWKNNPTMTKNKYLFSCWGALMAQRVKRTLSATGATEGNLHTMILQVTTQIRVLESLGLQHSYSYSSRVPRSLVGAAGRLYLALLSGHLLLHKGTINKDVLETSTEHSLIHTNGQLLPHMSNSHFIPAGSKLQNTFLNQKIFASPRS